MTPENLEDALEKIGDSIHDLAESQAKAADANVKVAETMAGMMNTQLRGVTETLNSIASEMRANFQTLRDGQSQRNVMFERVEGRFREGDQRMAQMVKDQETARSLLLAQMDNVTKTLTASIETLNKNQAELAKSVSALQSDRNKLWTIGLCVAVGVPIVLQIINWFVTHPQAAQIAGAVK